jgi:hypothetical protein
MSLRRTLSAITLAAAVGAMGCTSARYVSLDAGGSGVVAIPANFNRWPLNFRDEAEELMRQRCPEGYVIDHEEEVFKSQTVDAKEWQIHFHSKNALVEGTGVPKPLPTGGVAGGVSFTTGVTPASAPLPAEPVPVTAQ